MNYSPELKDALLRRMLPPNNESITKISREEGISEQTLRNWRDKARKEGYAAPSTDAVPDDWSTQDKFLVVVETASMNETELAEYARKKGLYVEQIKAWKDACMNANGGIAKEASRLNRELKDSEKERMFFAEAKCRLLQNVMYVDCCKQTLGATPPNPCKINGCGKLEPTFTTSVDSAITYKWVLQFSVFYFCNKQTQKT